MWILILIIIVIAIFYLKKAKSKTTVKATPSSDTSYETVTDAEKQQLSELGLLEETMEYLKKATDGDGNAMTQIGMNYAKINMPTKAVYWYTNASKADDALGRYFLGTAYANGYGVEKDERFGFGLIYSAARKGDPLAIFSLEEEFHMSKEDMIKEGIPVSRD